MQAKFLWQNWAEIILKVIDVSSIAHIFQGLMRRQFEGGVYYIIAISDAAFKRRRRLFDEIG